MFIKKIMIKSYNFAGCLFFFTETCLYRKYRKNVKKKKNEFI